jgi:hypothetical protein
MTQFEFTSICVKNCITPGLVWDNENFKKLVENDNLTNETLQKMINENF